MILNSILFQTNSSQNRTEYDKRVRNQAKEMHPAE